MRAVVLRRGRLEVRETPDPVPGPGELLLRTLSTAICASDVHYLDHPEIVTNDGTGRFVYDENRDIVMGHEFVGEVVGHGPDCTDQFLVGTRVTSMPILLRDAITLVIGQHPDAPGQLRRVDAISEGRLDPLPSVGMVVTLDGVADALDLARKAQGPPRIIVHPHD